MKRTIEVEDTLQDCVDGAIEEVKREMLSYLDSNPDTDKTPDINNDLDYSGAIHEIIDGAVPVYTSEIRDIFYLHGDDVEQAFDDTGIGSKEDEGWPSGWKAAAIYCYIEQQVHEWYRANADEVFEEWKEKQPKTALFERFEIHLTLYQARGASQPGKNASEDVAALAQAPEVAAQLAALDPAAVRAELTEYGAWDAAELADLAQNLQRILWLAAGNIREEN